MNGQQSPEQVIVNFQQLLGAKVYEAEMAKMAAQQFAMQLAEANVEIAKLKQTPSDQPQSDAPTGQ